MVVMSVTLIFEFYAVNVGFTGVKVFKECCNYFVFPSIPWFDEQQHSLPVPPVYLIHLSFLIKPTANTLRFLFSWPIGVSWMGCFQLSRHAVSWLCVDWGVCTTLIVVAVLFVACYSFFYFLSALSPRQIGMEVACIIWVLKSSIFHSVNSFVKARISSNKTTFSFSNKYFNFKTEKKPLNISFAVFYGEYARQLSSLSDAEFKSCA